MKRSATPFSLTEAVLAERATYELATESNMAYERLAATLVYGVSKSQDASKMVSATYAGSGLVLASLESFIPCTVRSIAENRKEKVLACVHLLDAMVAENDLGDGEGSAGVRCAKCGCSDVLFHFAQTRGADEPMTMYCTCRNPGCAKRWKM